MNEIFQIIGIIFRLPFYCIGAFLWLFIVMPLAVISCILEIIVIPIAFVAAAFRNNPQDFKDHIKHIFNFKASTDILRDLNRWLEHGDG